MAKLARSITDRDILDFTSKTFLDVMSPYQAMVWGGVFVLSWDNERIAKAISIDAKAVRNHLYNARQIVGDNTDIAYRSIGKKIGK